MEKKKIVMMSAMMAAIGTGAYLYFKNNPGKLEAMKHKMMSAAYDFEDEMM